MKNLKHPLAFLVYAIFFVFQGCATLGSSFVFQGPESISIGKTTRAEILAKYGKPFRVGIENGNEKWTYGYYQYRVFGVSQTKDLDLIFDKNGNVSTYTYASSDPDEVLNTVK